MGTGLVEINSTVNAENGDNFHCQNGERTAKCHDNLRGIAMAYRFETTLILVLARVTRLRIGRTYALFVRVKAFASTWARRLKGISFRSPR